MVRLYRLQQRLSITQHEALALLTLTSLFMLGLTVRHVQEQQMPPVAADSVVAQPVAKTAGSTLEANGAASEPDAPSSEHPLNLNEASREELQALSGIGPALSDRIVQYRTTQRPFRRVEELKRVSGIGPKTLADLRPVVTVNASEKP